jgi:1-phosphatidylinositol-4-phosphate 5-kinase
MRSVRPELNRMQIFKTNSNQSHGSGGMSGSFFFFTEDKKYIIKTMTFEEKNTLLDMLPNITKYFMVTAGRSLISRVYGIYKVKYPGMNRIYLMIQRNNIMIQKHNMLLNTFDLKGSKYKRKVIDDQKFK